MSRWIAGTVIVALLGAVVFVAVPRATGSGAAHEANRNPEREHTSAPPADQVVAEAKLVPERSAVLTLPIDGTVAEVLGREGERAEAGQLLARLDDSRQAAAVAQAEAGLRREQAALDELKAGPRPPEVAAARATIAGAEAQSELAETRHGTGSHQASIARAEVRRSAATLALTEAGVRQETVIAAEAAVVAAQSAVDQAKRSLADTELRAPFPGTIATLDLEIGENIAATSPVGSMADFSVWHMETGNVPEQSIARIHEGAAASIAFDAVPGLELSGRVTRIKPIGENKQGDIVYTVVVRPNQHDERLRWNMTASVTIQTEVAAASFAWPDRLPEGMALAVEDSWPFRALAPGREAEPFLIFRDGQRWMLIRADSYEAAPTMPGATTRGLSIGGVPAQLSRFPMDNFALVVEQADRPVRISGAGLIDDEIQQVAESLRALSADALQAQIAREAARRTLHLTLLWPGYVPDSMLFDPAASAPQRARPGSGADDDSYLLTFRGPDTMFQIGGNVAPPALEGAQERIAAGSLTGMLTVADGKHLLVVDADLPSAGGAPRFPAADSGSQRLPPLQQGRVFVLAENVDRSQFNRFVAGLAVVQPQEFLARTRGQSLANLTYLWPSRLPDGYAIDRSTAQTVTSDWVLQGGAALFSLTVSGTDGSAVIKGGRESSGAPFIVPEGSDVERVGATIHGRSASAARTAEGTIVVWSEQDAFYAISSRELPLEQLLEIAEALQPVSLDEFNRRLQ